jgi:class 3 adenylate cyclase/tetratricopeptide (TPR) repeat protein
MTIHTYIPQDRLRAIASNINLPDRTSGSALFADISGFTALTESLREKLGTRHGAEELSKQLGEVYSALILEVEKRGGSVIGFAGDAMMCWFHETHGSSSMRATACAIAMQVAIQAFPALGLKVVITAGDARRFVIGDPETQRIDTLAGTTVARTAIGEHLAVRGDVLVDEVAASSLDEMIKIKEWRQDEETGEKFAVYGAQGLQVEEQHVFAAETQKVTPVLQALRPYLHKAVYEREVSGQGAFLTEFRPCAALFIRFTGIDYDSDSAESELDLFVREVQKVASRHGGMLLDITIGDKGSYAYVNFGALNAHEDDSRRAVKAALELRNKTKLQLQMGITQGLMRVGAYGGETRKVFGALGDDVNLAARLMTTASLNEILLSSHVHKAVISDFTFEPRSPLPMKGKAEPLPVFAVTGESQKRAVRLQEPNYSLPMVGRQQELGIINDKLDLAAKGQGQVIGIVAEAGLGKSRLVAEVIRSARRKGFVGYGGACQSDGIHTPYLVWKSIWQAFFDIDPEMPERKLIRWLEGEIEDRVPSRMAAIPLLNTVLDLKIPDNEFTQNLEPQIRQSALYALLEDCLKATAGRGVVSVPDSNENGEMTTPLLLVMEDLHWIDALSHELLEGLAKALANYAVCFVLAYRPPQLERLQAPQLEALPQFTRIELHELTKAEAESAIRAKLAQLYPARGGALPSGLVDALMRRAQGNPFYLEELLNYVRDRGLDPAELHRIELPDSLHTLILSRIDQLSEQEKTTLRVASIVGRLFRANWLIGYYPELGSFPQVKDALDALSGLDITPLDTPEPELAYLFKHIVTHEVTYESLPFATRARLHEQLALYLENMDAGTAPLLDVIAFHYGHSENKEKQREYLHKAGEAAQKSFANDAALAYYEKLLHLLLDNREKVEIQLKRGEILALTGQYDDAEHAYRAALELAGNDVAQKASAQFGLGRLYLLRGDYSPALDWLEQAKKVRMALEDTRGLVQVLTDVGMVLYRKGDFEEARELLNDALRLAQRVKDQDGIVAVLQLLAGVALNLGENSTAQMLEVENLTLSREIGNTGGAAAALFMLGNLALREDDYAKARQLYEESLTIYREMGKKRSIALSLNNLGLVAYKQGDYAAAQRLFEENLTLSREMGDRWGISNGIGALGVIAIAQVDYAKAQTLLKEDLALNREMGDKGGVAIDLNNLGSIALIQGDYTVARAMYEESLALCNETNVKTDTAYSLLGLGLVDLAENHPEAREHIIRSLRLRQEIGEHSLQTSSLIGVAGLTLREGNPQFAAQLLGAVESALKALGAPIESELKNFHAQTLADVREQLGEAAFQSAWEEGSQWSLEEVVKVALEKEET